MGKDVKIESDVIKKTVSTSTLPMSPSTRAASVSGPTHSTNPTKPVVKSSQTSIMARMRRASSISSSRSFPDKGKGSATSTDDSSASYDAVVNFNAIGSRSTPQTTLVTPSRQSAHPIKRSRASIFVAASDALSITFNRKPRRTQPQPRLPTKVILPDVIEISAPHRDDEGEERERLRDAAAQSIGLGPVLLQDPLVRREDSIAETEEEEEDYEGGFEEKQDINSILGSGVGSGVIYSNPAEYESFDMGRRSPSASVLSIQQQHSPPLLPSNGSTGPRPRVGSRLAHSRSNSTSVPSVPPFPTTQSQIRPYEHTAAFLPKYYPPSSLRIFALAKHWKTRFLVLSCPPAARGAVPPVSYLHLFKGAGSEERELERMEINEDSVVFVAEEEVGGRRNVVKVGGASVGSLKKEWTHEEGGRTMWLLQITNPTESQRWIASIKNAILGQRTMRAGLGMSTPSIPGMIEPRGDMDVMLSMRAQGFISRTLPQPSMSSASSFRSMPAPKPAPIAPQAVSTLKGLFTRPRSSSRAASIDTERSDHTPLYDDSATPRRRPSLLADAMTPPQSPTSENGSVFPGTLVPTELRLERKIVTERQSVQWPLDNHATISARPTRLSVGALPLQPPPRKRPWTTPPPRTPPPVVAEEPAETPSVYNHAHANGSSFGILPPSPRLLTPRLPPVPSPVRPSFSSDERVRAPSLMSVSTFASAEGGERSIGSTQASSKRWSRQGVLPKRTNPPSGPPPSIPTQQTDSASGRSSSIRSGGFPGKRSSISSTGSYNSGLPPRPSSWHRSSMPPPPRPAPTFAPPPPPSDQSVSDSSSLPSIPAKSPFRDSAAHRAFRLSVTAPKPPPTTAPPPRPDEVGARLYPIPASPGTSPLPSLPDTIGPSRTSSSKHRLRILSVPSPTPSPPPSSSNRRNSASSNKRNSSSSGSTSNSASSSCPPTNLLTPASRARPSSILIYPQLFLPEPEHSTPSTPIGERITNLADISFLSVDSLPLITPSPASKFARHPSQPSEAFIHEPEVELPSLPPPPRRSSRQNAESELQVPNGEQKFMSLSQHGSLISLAVTGA